MVSVQVRADFRMDARRTFAATAKSRIFSTHLVHVGRGTSQITQIPFEVGHFSDGFYFLENTFLASADNELSLMSRDGTESTSAKASPVDVDRELDHFIGRNPLVFVFRMRKTGVRQVERHVQLSLRHGRIRRIGYHRLLSYLLKDAGCCIAVGFFLDMPEVLCLFSLILQAFFMRIECQVALAVRIFRQSGYLFL